MSYASLMWDFLAFRRAAESSRAKIDAVREKRLRALLAHAHDRSRYYRELYGGAGISRGDLATAPLAALPATDKAAIMERFDDAVCAPGVTRDALISFDQGEADLGAVFGGAYHVVHSSGSTGKPGYFLYDERAWRQVILGIIRGALWGMTAVEVFKLMASRPRVLYVAATDGRYGGVMAVGDGVASLKMEQRSLDINTPLSAWRETVREFDPSVVIGYPSAIKILAELLESGGADAAIRLVVSCGEPLGAGLRAFFESVFGASVVNFYGASESLALGVETDPAEGMVLFDDLNWIEASPDGMYLTSLCNFAQPLIRYRLSDELVVRGTPARSRCAFSRVESVRGRSEDLLWFDDGRGGREFLHPLAVEGFNVEGLRDYQFRKVGDDAFEMTAEVPDHARRASVRDEMLRQMRPILQANGLARIGFDVRFPDGIAPDPRTGKKRLIVLE